MQWYIYTKSSCDFFSKSALLSTVTQVTNLFVCVFAKLKYLLDGTTEITVFSPNGPKCEATCHQANWCNQGSFRFPLCHHIPDGHLQSMWQPDTRATSVHEYQRRATEFITTDGQLMLPGASQTLRSDWVLGQCDPGNNREALFLIRPAPPISSMASASGMHRFYPSN